jgi:23S rRNA (pseudouridine1915-N3)-methyltransferase
VSRYADRAGQTGRGVAVGPIDMREIAESRARRPEDRKREEAAAIRAALEPGAPLILLDEVGASRSSSDFAAQLGRFRDDGAAAMQFAIGGADGLDPDLRKIAAALLAFGRLTLPHQIVRILLAEQIYRATTILAGHPYHRE